MLTIAEEWLNSCSGCEIAVLNLGESLLDLLPQLKFVHMPVLMDNKYHGPLGRDKQLQIPKAAVGILSGGIRHDEHLEIAQRMREQVDILVALGTCAATGGLPALANCSTVNSLLDCVYHQSPSLKVQGQDDSEPHSDGALPNLLPRCTPVSDHVRVDLTIPGCPPHPDWIAEGLLSLLENRPIRLPYGSVCSVCPAKRSAQGHRQLLPARRMLEQPCYDPDQDLGHMHCLLEQGFLCLGPVTLLGCGGRHGAPKCIAARTPCRGCQGPVPHQALPFADYLAALTAAGVDGRSMPDKRGYLSRFNTADRVLDVLREARVSPEKRVLP